MLLHGIYDDNQVVGTEGIYESVKDMISLHRLARTPKNQALYQPARVDPKAHRALNQLSENGALHFDEFPQGPENLALRHRPDVEFSSFLPA